MSGTVCLRTASRLHFGLLSLPSTASSWLNHDGRPTLPKRCFGGVGLMIDKPDIFLTAEEADEWSALGPFTERVLSFAKVYCDAVGVKKKFRLLVNATAWEHAGLGTGTQLGLAVARAIASLTQSRGVAELMQPACDAVTLARRVGRGLRSALGIHGFEAGGFLVEGGKTSEGAISPLLIRCEFPEDWRLLLITPRDMVGLHGRREADGFADLLNQPPNDRTTETLCRLVLLGLAPALAERDRATFGEALYDFNRRSGEMFRVVQGGLYAHPRIEAIITAVRDFGIKGVGQSSWGPTIFALAVPEELPLLCEWLRLRQGIANEEMIVTSARNRGAETVLSTEY
jgi:beta-ribofuranosylaminobenzene 5'-phosphate synthase